MCAQRNRSCFPFFASNCPLQAQLGFEAVSSCSSSIRLRSSRSLLSSLSFRTSQDSFVSRFMREADSRKSCERVRLTFSSICRTAGERRDNLMTPGTEPAEVEKHFTISISLRTSLNRQFSLVPSQLLLTYHVRRLECKDLVSSRRMQAQVEVNSRIVRIPSF